jgi:hypothetical protein
VKVDLFCRVIDNYGDIGVCWRLSRQLVAEHGLKVRLIVDDLRTFQFVAPQIDATLDTQEHLGVKICAWPSALNFTDAALVIEAFACDPPETYVQQMAQAAQKPAWINLEYLSAETWIDGTHGLPSPHPRLPLTKYFFFPGFSEGSGGLLREQSIVASPDALHNEPLRVFCFSYPQAPIRALQSAFERLNVAAQFHLAAPVTDAPEQAITPEPVPQTEFDALLASFDLLIVRGEDSFVRAQLAAKPMLWHIYPTDDNAHYAKLEAWLQRYCDTMPQLTREAYIRALYALNALPSADTSPDAFAGLINALPELYKHAKRWQQHLLRAPDLATRLVRFVDLVKKPNLG